MLSINSKYWIIILKLSSWFTFQRANKYILGVLGKQKHQLLSHARKTQSRNQGNKQENLARMKGNAVNYDVGDLHDRFKSTKERTDQLKRAPPKKRRNQIRSALVGNREAEAVQVVRGGEERVQPFYGVMDQSSSLWVDVLPRSTQQHGTGSALQWEAWANLWRSCSGSLTTAQRE